MTYVSPFKLLPSINLGDKGVDYKLLRRKLLAEFELNDDQPLEVNGTSIGKTEALDIIEGLKDQEVLDQHLEIFNNQDLLSFLEGKNPNYILDEANYKNAIPEVAQESFVELLNKELVKSYKQNDDQLLGKIMSFPAKELMRENLGISIYERFYKAAKSDLLELKEILELDEVPIKLKRLKQCQEIYSEDRAKCINFLSDEFSNLINDYSIVSINLSVRIYKGRGDKKIPLKLCLFVSSLYTTEEYLDLANGNYKIIDEYGVVSNLVTFKKYLRAVVILSCLILMGYIIFDISNSDESKTVNNTEVVGPWDDIVSYISNTISRSDTLDKTDVICENGCMAKTRYYDKYSKGEQQISFQNFSDKDVVIGVIAKGDVEPERDSGELSHCWYLVKNNSSLIIQTDTTNEGLVSVVGEKWFSSDKGFLYDYSQHEGCNYLIEPAKDGYFYGEVTFYFLDSSRFMKKDSILICTIEKN